MAVVGDVVLPGDVLHNLQASESSNKTILGPGLRYQSETISVCKPGLLRFREPNVYWVDSHQKRYIPVRGENVMGIVTAKAGDIFRVDIGASGLASLPYLAFEGTTKKNRPDVKIGDLVYAKFLVANKDMEPELVCMDSTGKANGLGVIRNGGFVFLCPLNLIRKILGTECILLKALGNSLPYEIAIGMNGRIWVKAHSVTETIAVANAINSAEFMDNEQIRVMVRRLVDALAGF